MTPIIRQRQGYHSRLAGYLDKLGDCGNVGLMIGIMAGGLLTLLVLTRPVPMPTPGEIWAICGMLALFCWMMLILIYWIVLQVQVSSILMSTLVRSVVICTVIVWIAAGLNAFAWGILIGILVGLFFGLVVCGFINKIRG